MERNTKRDLMDALPRYYADSAEVDAIMSANTKEIDRIRMLARDITNQLYVDTATYGLARWERIVGVETFENKPINERRSVIKAKLRGAGVVTAQHIKDVAEAWYGGETEVTEAFSTYAVIVKFVAEYGVPTNLGDVEKALREIIPAHLALVFEFKFVVYNAAKAYYADYNALISQGRTYDEVKNGGL